ncbi:MAG: N-succinylarginine dihydrolase [Planctomycetota bacterium]|nr:N-succinylarginine dihydrolase [Planctomycetota bacterium]
MKSFEVNFDGLVGPTHNYAGLSFGNLASARHRNLKSSPKKAALQGLDKMRMLHELGVQQAVLPPQLRPDISFLRNCGFDGSVSKILDRVSRQDPVLLAVASSSACMWTANAATVSASADASDGCLHLSPANLLASTHRTLESQRSWKVLSRIFDGPGFQVHTPLPVAPAFSDEGAANHMRITPSHEQSAIEIFVYGRNAFDSLASQPKVFPARQTLQAFQAIARRHRLRPDRTMFWKQNPIAIDKGAFHNDVVAVANESVLFCHQDAFEDQENHLGKLKEIYREFYSSDLFVVQVSRSEMTLEAAVQCYLFNSQLVTLPSGTMMLVAPSECENHPAARKVIERLVAGDNPVQDSIFPDVRQSMMNGGGPACLRLRIPLNESQLMSVHQPVRFTNRLEVTLRNWIEAHYREELSPEDLADSKLQEESKTALVELEAILEFEESLLSNGIV